MNDIRFKTGTTVSIEGVVGRSVIESICEAKRFCIDEGVKEVELTCNGYLFLITPETDVLDELKQYFGSAAIYGQGNKVMTAFKDIIEHCEQTTTGNVAHKMMIIKGIAANTVEMITKNIG